MNIAKPPIPCCTTKAAKLLGDIWTLLIIKRLMEHSRRFCDLQNSLSAPDKESVISSKTLTQRLKMLENEGILDREVTKSSPIKVEYLLTPKGQDLSKVIKALNDFGVKYM
jgi:DNA-binding HxlR family transcriptional regulator